MRLIFTDTDGNIKLDKILKHSECLAKDIYTCYQRYMNNKGKWKKTEKTISCQIRYITTRFDELLEILNPDSKHKLLSTGLVALNESQVWNHLEYASLNTCLRTGKGIKNAFITLVRLFNDDLYLHPPSRVNLKGYITDISKLYEASELLFEQYKNFLVYIVDSDRDQHRLRRIKASTHATLVQLIQNKEFQSSLGEYGLRAFAVNSELIKVASKADRYNPIHFQLMLAHFDSKTFSQKMINIRGQFQIDFTDIHNISSRLYNDIECYSKIIGNTVDSHLKDNSVRDKFSGFKRALPVLQSALSTLHNKELIDKGIATLTDTEGLLKQLHDDITLPRWIFFLFYEISQCIYPQKTPKLSLFRENLLLFPGIDKNRYIQCDFTSIKSISERVYDDFVLLLNDFKANIDQKNIAMISVYHNYQQLKALLNKYSDSFTQAHLDVLILHGIKGFATNNGFIQKHLLAELQSSANDNSLARKTALTYRSSLVWLMREFDIPFNDIYPIKVTKMAKHNQRLNSDSFYSETECRELAFYIEKLLRDENTSVYRKILLCFGKVILKTGWNINPLLNLECEDIIETVSPISNKTEYAVVLQKARGGYRNDTYSFDKRDLKNDTIKSAISDLLIVRDELTADIRLQTRHGKYLFIYPQRGQVFKLEYSSVNQLSSILRKSGCRINFVAQKIRKGGVNHIYREVNKNIKKYTDTVKHSFDVFESYYLRIDPDQSRYSLNQATKIMGDYFTGKEISSEIHIITDESANQHQVVPSGTCAAKADNKEANRYEKEHRKLRQITGDKGSNVCADFLSCVWCKYFRVVVDAEHIWKLLSYRNYILLGMEMSVENPNDSNDQIININILKQRVDDIIENLRQRNSKAVKDGFMLLKEQGLHPDWEFACPSMAMFREENNLG
ncbi:MULTISPECIES: hypothetical protein [Pseudoalteromonas]|uniref:hypothetical protein n=1 Tax=Pseudoalteromonas TaxID=53246 RepID=UPI0015FBC018|nr:MULTISPECIES: hypothetical protein [unclassified Pseudoalteromonas]MBB1378055.1 hypothetical protein [Pseudoalteromonas sp. SR43-2]MBH0004309.1 hypothetical protein [Pseudoalteromonas sp. SWYJZ12]